MEKTHPFLGFPPSVFRGVPTNLEVFDDFTGVFSGAHFAELLNEAANAEGFGRVDVVVCNAGTGGCLSLPR